MASILQAYGIKEVADCVFYELKEDGTPGAPVLLLDTLKVSTIETTAETTYATGGKGNPRLVGWDFSKEITVSLEDALFSPKSMAVMFGDGQVDTESTTAIRKTIKAVAGEAGVLPTKWEDHTGKERTIPETKTVVSENGTEIAGTPEAGDVVYITFDVPVEGMTIEISANTFPGTYYITGDTLVRNENTGKDEAFQFIIPKGKVTSENTITMEADGDPSVFSMTVDVLRAGGQDMMKLVKYDFVD